MTYPVKYTPQKITAQLTDSELKLLKQIAALECRRPEDQARFFIVQGLKSLAEQYKDELDKISALLEGNTDKTAIN